MKTLKQIKEDVAYEWSAHRLQMIGTFLLAFMVTVSYIEGHRIRWALATSDFWSMPLSCLSAIVILGLDLYLIAHKKMTITRWWRSRITNRVVDLLIAIALVGFTWWYIHPVFAIFEIRGVISGHLNWN